MHIRFGAVIPLAVPATIKYTPTAAVPYVNREAAKVNGTGGFAPSNGIPEGSNFPEGYFLATGLQGEILDNLKQLYPLTGVKIYNTPSAGNQYPALPNSILGKLQALGADKHDIEQVRGRVYDLENAVLKALIRNPFDPENS